MLRTRSGKSVEGDESTLASAFIYLSALRMNEYGETIDVSDYFARLYCDKVINLKTDCEGGHCVIDVLWWLQLHGYVSRGSSPSVTLNGLNFLRSALELTLEDSARIGDYEETVYQMSARLMRELSRINLDPLIVPSFPLIGAGVYYRRNEGTGRWHRYIIPDMIVRLDGRNIPPELGLSRYLGIELQRTNFARLKEKESKYLTFNGSDENVSRREQLYPVYLLQSNRVRSAEGGRKLLEQARKQVLKALRFLPQERDDRLIYNMGYFYRSGGIGWLFPLTKWDE